MKTGITRRALAGVAVLAVAGTLAACSSGDPLKGGSGDKSDLKTLVIGSQSAGENDILAQIYGQVLAANGYTISYSSAIGSRETFLPALKDGSIDLIPDYAGNLLYASDKNATATSAEDVEKALPAAVKKDGLAVLAASSASDADSLVVTPEFAKEHDLKEIGDLAPIASQITIGANTEFEGRPYGRTGLEKTYGVTGWKFKAIDDYGGPGTLKDLLANNIQVADIYTTTPSIKQNKLVVLEDPKHLIAAQNLVPLLNKKFATDEIAKLLDPVSKKLTTDDLLDLNEKFSGSDKPTAEKLAKDWLTDNGFLK